MNCPNCGGSIPDTASFCPLCGSGVDVNAASSANEQSGSYEKVPNYNQAGQQNFGQSDYNQYNNGPQGYNQPPMGGRFKPRNIALCIIFSFITCGIYGLYWMYQLNEQMNDLSGDQNATGGGMVILLSIITCNIYAWFWLYKMGERAGMVKQRMGRSGGSDSVLYLILAIFGLNIVAYALMQDTINNAVESGM
ncbi:protein of unknown function [Lachnospiraceae bacterium]|nr:protein of unknown function [Lachnospiraceae bacterium]